MSTPRSKLTKLFRNESSYEADEVNLLLDGLNEMEITSKFLAKAAESEKRGIDAIASWAKRSRNSAIDDVMQHTAQLFHLFTEKQKQFVRDHDHFVQQLKKISEIEYRVREYEKNVHKRETRVLSIRKQITRSSYFWKKSTTEMAALRRVEDEATLELEKARRRLISAQQEAEVVKMFLFRQGMMGLADSYRILNEHSRTIFNCHREITEMVPALTVNNINNLTYDGVPFTRERLNEVRRALTTEDIRIQYNPPGMGRPTRPLSHYQPGTPPPPYSAVSRAPQFPVSSFSDSQIRGISEGLTTPLNVAPIRVATAPLPTPLSASHCSNRQRIYPDLTQELRNL
ncbi:unnamed protein product [Bursaphelenchus okinawaensis]|uniref:Uncharacterized protein n=1 Tax=Bursaphelenchus okinawaensis TaxID=465554 RepID=A0A811L947_9BILA|nr:unnamed protein product [Bursaphelenchus okinawaensis]CAG9119764.1 unnamed protein product [Bursaphelenchus okinawaensis]